MSPPGGSGGGGPDGGVSARPRTDATDLDYREPSRAEGVKRDRLARFYRVVQFLAAHPEGARVDAIAAFVRTSRRTVYRDLLALEGEIDVPVWNDQGTWGLAADAQLPALRLSLPEAMALFLSVRLMARYADEYDPDLAAAFQKLAGVLPPVLAAHTARTLDVLARRRPDEAFARHVRLLARAWAESRVVALTYDAATYQPERGLREARVQPYLIEPSPSAHGLYLIGFDEARGATRTFKIERIREASLTPDRFEPPPPGQVEDALSRAWEIIADQDEVEVVLRFSPVVARRVAEATWHPTQRCEPEEDGSMLWRAVVAGTLEIRTWILGWGADVEVLAPQALRDEVAGIVRAAAAVYEAG